MDAKTKVQFACAVTSAVCAAVVFGISLWERNMDESMSNLNWLLAAICWVGNISD